MPVVSPDYSLQGVYGCEPWKPVAGKSFSDAAGLVPVSQTNAEFGGGAEITAQNLLINAWSITEEDGEGIPNQGAQLIPFYGVDLVFPSGLDPTFLSEGVTPVFDSRTSANFVIGSLGDEFAPPLLGVMNPPGGMKALLQKAFKNITPDPGSALGVSGPFGGSLLSLGAWAYNVSGGGGGQDQIVDYSIELGSAGGTLTGILPLLKTSGADGDYPEFFTPFPVASAGEIQEFLDAMNTGNFFVPFLLDWDTESSPTAQLTIAWPHSAARGM